MGQLKNYLKSLQLSGLNLQFDSSCLDFVLIHSQISISKTEGKQARVENLISAVIFSISDKIRKILLCFSMTFSIFLVMIIQSIGKLAELKTFMTNIEQLDTSTKPEFGLGAYFQYSPIQFPKQNQYEEKEQRMLLLAIVDPKTKVTVLLHSLLFQLENKKILHLITLSSGITHTYEVNPLQYEGRWHMFYFRYSAINLKGSIQISDVQKLQNIIFKIESSILNQGPLQVQYTGDFINPKDPSQVYGFFRGLYYKIIQANDFSVTEASLFADSSSAMCLCLRGIEFENQYLYLRGDKYNFTTMPKSCSNYSVEAWIKLVNPMADLENQYDIIQIGHTPLKEFYKYLGGVAFRLTYQFSNNNFNIAVKSYNYSFPTTGQAFESHDPSSFEFSFTAVAADPFKWHYFRFYQTTSSAEIRVSFPNEKKDFIQNFGRIFQFSSTEFYVYIGGNILNKQMIEMVISNFTLNNCFSLRTFSLTCHSTCQACDGPSATDCLACYPSQFRELKHRQCICLFGYVDYDMSDCITTNQQFQIISVPLSTPKGYKQKGKVIECLFGYFLQEGKCLKCPSVILPDFISCFSCLDNPEYFSIKLMCSTSQQLQEKTFQLIDQEFQSQYFIDQEELVLCIGCMLGSSDSGFYHQQKQIKLSCSPPFVFKDGQCLKSFTQTDILECGQFCKRCDSRKRCLECQENSKFFLSSDRVHCEPCLIQFCQYCYLYDLIDPLYQTLSQEFIPVSRSRESLKIGCALCQKGYSFNFQSEKCEPERKILNCQSQFITSNDIQQCILSKSFLLSLSIINCENYIPNCLKCQINQYTQQIKCNSCVPGYYPSKFTGVCISCLSYTKNCQLNTQKYNDYWRFDVESFFNQKYNQLQLYDNDPQTYTSQCGDNCQYCQNGLLYCSQCKRGISGQEINSLDPGNKRDCLKCPYYCQHCEKSSLEKILLYNPGFGTNFQTLPQMYKCFVVDQKFQNRLQIDTYGQVIICDDSRPCFIKGFIQQILTCIQFNILSGSRFLGRIDNFLDYDLVAGRSVEIFYFEFFLNFNGICQTAIIQFQSRLQLNSPTMRQLGVVFQGQNSSLSVETQFLLNEFGFILIKDLRITINQRAAENLMLFKSVFNRIEVQLENLNITNNLLFSKTINFMLQNVRQLNLTNVTIENQLISQDFFQILQLNSTVTYDRLVIKNLRLINCKFRNANFFTFNTQWAFDTLISIDSLEIRNCEFLNATLFGHIGPEFTNSFESLDNVRILESSFKNSSVFRIPNTIKVNLKDIYLFNNQILDTVIFDMYYADFLGLIIEQNMIFQSTIVKLQVDLGESLRIDQFQISHNTILNDLPLIWIVHNSDNGKIYLQNSKIFNNTQYLGEHVSFQAILFLNGYFLNIQNMEISQPLEKQRLLLHAIGFQQILIANIYVKTIGNSLNLLSLKQDCLGLTDTMAIFNFKDNNNIIIQNITFENIVLVTQPLIQIIKNQFIQTQKIQLKFEDIKLNHILMIKVTENIPLTLVNIMSDEDIDLIIKDFQAYSILMHYYIKDFQKISGMLVTLNSPKTSIFFANAQLAQLFVSNSTDPVFWFNCQSLEVKNLTAIEVNSFNFNLFNKFIKWNFFSEDLVYVEQLEKIFGIESEGGLLRVSSKKFKVENSTIQQSLGKMGGVFYVETKRYTEIQINSCKITNARANLGDLESQGGFLYILSLNSELNLYISNLILDSVSSKLAGGAIFISPSTSFNKITITNSSFRATFSSSGGLLHIVSQQSSQMMVYLDQLEIFDSNLLNFLQQSQITSTLGAANLIQDNYLIIVERAAKVVLNNCRFHSLRGVSVFRFKDVRNLILNDVIISNFTLLMHPVMKIHYENNMTAHVMTNNLQIHSGKLDILFLNKVQTIAECKELAEQSLNFRGCDAQSSIPYWLPNYETKIQKNQELCSITHLQNYLVTQNLSSLIAIISLDLSLSFSTFDTLITGIMIPHTYALQGLFKITGHSFRTSKILIQNTIIQENNCGSFGCIFLKSIAEVKSERQIILKDSWFLSNQAENGGGVFNSGSDLQIQDSFFINNWAMASGGAIYNQFFALSLINTQFNNNSALLGNDVYNYLGKLSYRDIQFIKSQKGAEQQLMTTPSQLCLQVTADSPCLEQFRQHGEYGIIDEVIYPKSNSVNASEQNHFLMIPSGQRIFSYNFFHETNQTFEPSNLILRLVAVNEIFEKVTILNSTACKIFTRNFDRLSSQPNEYQFSHSVLFDQESKTYNLENSSFTFDPYSPNDLSLDIKVTCEKILHQNYSLVFKLRTFQCQMGEYYYYGNCYQCDPEKSYYSIDPLKGKCEIRNELNSLEVKSSMIRLKPGYWRYKIKSSQILECSNRLTNCQGGWEVGDSSCTAGYIGALCEECDIYDVKANGKYVKTSDFSCLECGQYVEPLIKGLVLLCWTLLSIQLTGESVYQSNLRLKQLKLTNIHYKIIYKQSIDQISITIKQITNFYQIISAIQTLRLSFNFDISFTMSLLGNPGKSIQVFIDCFLSNSTSTDILYIRLILIIIFPIVLFQLSLCIFWIKNRIAPTKRKLSIIWTYILFIYVLHQPGIFFDLTSMLGFRRISDETWVKAEVSYRYFTKSHLTWIFALVVPGLAFFGLIIPLLLLQRLYQMRKDLFNIKLREKFSYLINEYREESWFWEILKNFQRMLIIASLNMYSDQLTIKFILVVFVILGYFILVTRYNPYTQTQLTKMELKSVVVQLTSILLGIGTFSGLEQQEKISYIFLSALILLIALQTASFVYKLLEGTIRKLNMILFERYAVDNHSKNLFLKKMNNIIIRKRQQQQRVESRFKILKGHLRNQSKIISLVKSQRIDYRSSERIQFEKNNLDTTPKFTEFMLSPRQELAEQNHLLK